MSDSASKNKPIISKMGGCDSHLKVQHQDIQIYWQSIDLLSDRTFTHDHCNFNSSHIGEVNNDPLAKVTPGGSLHLHSAVNGNNFDHDISSVNMQSESGMRTLLGTASMTPI
jgi:hypothetical protein